MVLIKNLKSGKRNRSSIKKKAIISKPLKQAIKRIVGSSEEVKTQTYGPTSVNLVKVGTANWSNTCIYGISPTNANSPAIVQGVGQGDRVGNKIRTKKVMLNFILNAASFDAAFNLKTVPQFIRVTIYRDRLQQGSIFPTSVTTLGGFLQSGNISVPLSGNFGDLLLLPDTDRYIVYSTKIYKIGFAFNGGTGVDVANQSYANNTFEYSRRVSMDVTKYVPKIIHYDDTTTYPSSPGIFVFFDSINADGSAAVANNWDTNLTVSTTFTYTDA